MNLLKSMEDNELFSQSELIIRNYVLNEKENIMTLTVNDIAVKNYVSKSTLIRFSRKLGFSGWNEFKLHFLKELDFQRNNIRDVDYNFPFTEHDSPMFIANKLLVMKKDSLDDTLKLLDIGSLKKAVNLISKQNKIHIFADGYSLLSSDDFCFRMTRIGKLVTNMNDMGMSYIAQSLHEQDLGIIVSYSGRTKGVVKTASLLKKNNVPIISITTKDDNPISELSDISFHLPTKEHLYSKISNYSTVDSMRYIFDILFSLYFTINFNSNLANRVSLAKVVDKKDT